MIMRPSQWNALQQLLQWMRDSGCSMDALPRFFSSLFFRPTVFYILCLLFLLLFLVFSSIPLFSPLFRSFFLPLFSLSLLFSIALLSLVSSSFSLLFFLFLSFLSLSSSFLFPFLTSSLCSLPPFSSFMRVAHRIHWSSAFRIPDINRRPPKVYHSNKLLACIRQARNN